MKNEIEKVIACDFDGEKMRKLGILPLKELHFPNVVLEASHLFRKLKMRRTELALHWISDHFIGRWNRLHIKTLEPHWCDTDTKMLHGMFQMLTDFVEGEQPFDRTVFTHEHPLGTKIVELYLWWKHDPFAKDNTPSELYPVFSPFRFPGGSDEQETLQNYIRRIEHFGRDLPPEHWFWDVYRDYVKSVDGLSKFVSLNKLQRDRETNGFQVYAFINAIEQAAINEETKHMIELVEIRKSLWT